MMKISELENENLKAEEDFDHLSAIVDTRYQSFVRVYIHDLLNSELIHINQDVLGLAPQRAKTLAKLNEIYLQKVAICGTIVSIKEHEKNFCIDVDDSTGVIQATIWKTCTSIIRDPTVLDVCSRKLLANASAQAKRTFDEAKPRDVYDTIEMMRRELDDRTVNHSIFYEPKQGELVLVKGYLNFFNNRLSLKATSCVRVQSSVQELTQIMLPSILADKCYSTRVTEQAIAQAVTPTKAIERSILIQQQSKQDQANEENRLAELVFNRLVEFTKPNVGAMSSMRNGDVNVTLPSSSCSVKSLFNSIRNSNAKLNLTQAQILNALKKLEMRGLVYSCEDEFHYLPI